MRIRSGFFVFLFLLLPTELWSHHKETDFSVKASGVSQEYRVSIKYMGSHAFRHHYQLKYWLAHPLSCQRLRFIDSGRRLWEMTPEEFHQEVSQKLTDNPQGYYLLDVNVTEGGTIDIDDLEGRGVFQSGGKVLEQAAQDRVGPAEARSYTSLLLEAVRKVTGHKLNIWTLDQTV